LIPFLAGFFTAGIGAILHTLSFALTGSYSGTVIKDAVLMAIMRAKTILAFITFAFGVFGLPVPGERRGFLADPFFYYFPANGSLNPLLSPGTLTRLIFSIPVPASSHSFHSWM
jgi:hypothetical protein